MNSLPIRNDKSIFADATLRGSAEPSAFFLFIEDENTPFIYQKIVNKVAPEIKLDKIYSLKSKKNVLAHFNEWKTKENNIKNCLFIIDKDFDYWKEETILEDIHLLELPCYTLENLFFNINAAQIIMSIYNNGVDLKNYNDDYWKNWIDQTFEELEKLFLLFALVIKNDLQLPNCNTKPQYFVDFKDGNPKLKIDVFLSYKENIKGKLLEKSISMENEIRAIRDFYDDGGRIDYHSLIKGKHLMYALIANIRILLDKSIPNPVDNSLLTTLVHELPSANFSCFEDRLKQII
ncbi:MULTISPECIES: DUF4435 domain-containing protein [unclassified Enterococcus]|uniref:DUF4435 domain-containing protein n=1 Tax=unclassified Enterococcus TaxID=2608891 RepID=UPI003D2B7367